MEFKIRAIQSGIAAGYEILYKGQNAFRPSKVISIELKRHIYIVNLLSPFDMPYSLSATEIIIDNLYAQLPAPRRLLTID